MKRIVGYILLLLFFIAFWAFLSFIFYNGGLSLLTSIVLPFCCYIIAALIAGFLELIVWLLN